MGLSAICDGLLDELEKFDGNTQPLGLYASDQPADGKSATGRHKEWMGAILPYLTTHGCRTHGFRVRNRDVSYTICELPSIGETEIVLVNFSNIKVRKYGSGYYVDKQEDRAERWDIIDLAGRIREVWKKPDCRYGFVRTHHQILLFIGFDKSQRPFERELDQMHMELKWDMKRVAHSTRFWADKANRGFGVRLAGWSRLADTEE